MNNDERSLPRSKAGVGPAANAFLASLWRADAPLTGAGLLLLAALAASLVGLRADPRAITGAPAWLKPVKFAVSTAVYCFTLAWIFTYLPGWTRTRRSAGRITAAALVLEVALIDLQAARGTTSHFNVVTPFDGAVFTVMGLTILLQTITAAAVAVALWRQAFIERALGWALRFGLTISIAGAMTGGLMTRPTAAQLAAARETGIVTVFGSHTVGAPDGGPGLPVTGWSREHGDLRVPHFLGLHAMQVLPLLAIAIGRRWTDRTRVRLVLSAALGYSGLFALLLWQALSGQPLIPVGLVLYR